jgi:hypothetical protein
MQPTCFYSLQEDILKGRRFLDIKDIKRNLTAKLNEIAWDSFEDCFVHLFRKM